MHKSFRFVHFFYCFMRFSEYLCGCKKALKLNGSKNLQNGGKFADGFFVSFVKKFSFRKNCPNRLKTACFCPNGSKMVVNQLRPFS